MKKITSKTIILLAIILSAASCGKDHLIRGKGPNVTNVRSVSGFTAVSLSMKANVELFRDSVFRIELNGQQNILNVITTKVKGNTLDIDLKRFAAIIRHNPVTIRVFMPYLSSMDVSGSGNMNCRTPFISESLNTTISGSGNISFQGTVNNSLNANVSGSGGIQFFNNNSCLNAKYNVSGSGDINAEWLKADYVDAHISGSGDLRVYAVKQLNADISGSGDIAYRGRPGVSSRISGSGKLTQIQ